MSIVLELLEPAESIPFLKGYNFPPYITLAHVYNAPSGWKLPLRTLSQHQLQYVLDGIARYQVEENEYLTGPGDLIYHGPHQRHSVTLVTGEPYVCLSVVFHFGDVSSPLHGVTGGRAFLGNFKGGSIEEKLTTLTALYHTTGIVNQLRCQGLLLEVLAEIAGSIGNHRLEERPEGKWKAKIILIRNFIVEHYGEQISHEDFERISGLSRNYIILKFRELYGMTPFAYLTRVRVEHAKELAIQSNLSIHEIACQVGYQDIHSFGRMFKRTTGVSLSQFISSLVTY